MSDLLVVDLPLFLSIGILTASLAQWSMCQLLLISIVSQPQQAAAISPRNGLHRYINLKAFRLSYKHKKYGARDSESQAVHISNSS
jgi:hypothetical protein